MGDIDTVVVDGLKALDLKRPIREADINSAYSDGPVRAELHRSARVISDLDFFSDGGSVVHLDTEVPHRTLNFRVAEQ